MPDNTSKHLSNTKQTIQSNKQNALTKALYIHTSVFFRDSGLQRDPACLGLTPDEEELEIAMLIEYKTEGGSCVGMLRRVPFDASSSLNEMQSKYALSSACQAHLTTVSGTICCPGTRVPEYPVDPVPVP